MTLCTSQKRVKVLISTKNTRLLKSGFYFFGLDLNPTHDQLYAN